MTYQLDVQSRLVLAAGVQNSLQGINRLGNQQVSFATDPSRWPELTRWTLQTDLSASQPSDGYVLWKLDRLMTLGIPAPPLLFTICKDETGANHSVLCVSTSGGDYVLDSRFDELKLYTDLKQLGYAFLFRTQLGGSLSGLWDRIASYR